MTARRSRSPADGLHMLDVRGSDGSTATFAIPIDATRPTIRLTRPGPTDGLTFLSVDLVDYSAAMQARASRPAAAWERSRTGRRSSDEQHADIHRDARDNARKHDDARRRTYTVWQWTGFNQPVDNPPTLNVRERRPGDPGEVLTRRQPRPDSVRDAYPASVKVSCATDVPVDTIETTVTAADRAACSTTPAPTATRTSGRPTTRGQARCRRPDPAAAVRQRPQGSVQVQVSRSARYRSAIG